GGSEGKLHRDLRGIADPNLAGVREALRAGEAGTRVDDDGMEAQRTGKLHERDRHRGRAEDEQPRRRAMELEEQLDRRLAQLELDRSAASPGDHPLRGCDGGRIEVSAAQRTGTP